MWHYMAQTSPSNPSPWFVPLSSSTEFLSTPPTPIPGQPLVLQLEWRGHRRHRWKSIKWLELTGMENVSAMIQTQPSLITTLMHSTLVADPLLKCYTTARPSLCGFSLTRGRWRNEVSLALRWDELTILKRSWTCGQGPQLASYKLAQDTTFNLQKKTSVCALGR